MTFCDRCIYRIRDVREKEVKCSRRGTRNKKTVSCIYFKPNFGKEIITTETFSIKKGFKPAHFGLAKYDALSWCL